MGQGREPGSPQKCCRYFPPSSSMYLLCLLLLGDFQNIQLLAALLYAFFSVIFKIFSLLAFSISISSKELVAVVVVEKMQQGWNNIQPRSCVPSAPTQQCPLPST